MMHFHYDKNILTTQSDLKVSVSDLRDVIQAFNIPNEAQRLKELQVVLESVMRKNHFPNGSMGVE
jgi:carbamate kinase